MVSPIYLYSFPSPDRSDYISLDDLELNQENKTTEETFSNQESYLRALDFKIAQACDTKYDNDSVTHLPPNSGHREPIQLNTNLDDQGMAAKVGIYPKWNCSSNQLDTPSPHETDLISPTHPSYGTSKNLCLGCSFKTPDSKSDKSTRHQNAINNREEQVVLGIFYTVFGLFPTNKDTLRDDTMELESRDNENEQGILPEQPRRPSSISNLISQLPFARASSKFN